MTIQESLKKFNAIVTLVLLFIFIVFLKVNFAQDNKPLVTNIPKPTESNSSKDKQDDVIRVDTDLVTIPATVLDRDGRYIINLKKEDFRIFENGVEQEVEFFDQIE